MPFCAIWPKCVGHMLGTLEGPVNWSVKNIFSLEITAIRQTELDSLQERFVQLFIKVHSIDFNRISQPSMVECCGQHTL